MCVFLQSAARRLLSLTFECRVRKSLLDCVTMMVDALLDSSSWASIDVVKILGYGVLGLGFLLALLAYHLLSKEQGKQTPRPDAFRAIYVFMGFSLVLCILGLVSQFFDAQAAGQKDGQAAGQKSDAFMGTVANDATQFSVASAVQPYPERSTDARVSCTRPPSP